MECQASVHGSSPPRSPAQQQTPAHGSADAPDDEARPQPSKPSHGGKSAVSGNHAKRASVPAEERSSFEPEPPQRKVRDHKPGVSFSKSEGAADSYDEDYDSRYTSQYNETSRYDHDDEKSDKVPSDDLAQCLPSSSEASQKQIPSAATDYVPPKHVRQTSFPPVEEEKLPRNKTATQPTFGFSKEPQYNQHQPTP